MSIAVRAFVVGYTGETGKALVKTLAKDPRYASVKLIGRRQVDVDYGLPPEKASGKFSIHTIDFDHLENHQMLFEDTDVGFSVLGTTLKKSGEKGMWKIDHDYTVQLAELAVSSGCKEMHIVTTKGADAKSQFFYNRVKGQTEEDVKATCIFPNYVAFYRPGLLMGSRSERRVLESMTKILIKPLAFLFPTWITTPVTTLAQAMANAPFSLRSVMRDESRKPGSTVDLDDFKAIVVENSIIFKLADEPVPSAESAEGDTHSTTNS